MSRLLRFSPSLISQMRPLIGLTTSELENLAGSLGEPAFRGRQLSEWIYKRGASAIEQMANLPREFRAELESDYAVGLPPIAHTDRAPDGTIKYLLELSDREQVESVYLPYGERVSVCLSCQVGCPAGCTFCATAL